MTQLELDNWTYLYRMWLKERREDVIASISLCRELLGDLRLDDPIVVLPEAKTPVVRGRK